MFTRTGLAFGFDESDKAVESKESSENEMLPRQHELPNIHFVNHGSLAVNAFLLHQHTVY